MTLGRPKAYDVILVSQLPSIGYLMHLEPIRAYQEPVGSTKDNPNNLSSEGGSLLSLRGIYLTCTDINDMLSTFESGGRPKQMDYICGHD